MNNNSVEKEYRASQLYKTLKGSDSSAANQVARGLEKAAQGIDAALDTVVPAIKNAGQNHSAAPKAAQTQQTTTVFRGNKHPYQYTYSTAPVPPRNNQQAGSRQTGGPAVGSQQAYSQQPGRPRPGNAQSVRKPAGVNPAPAPQMPQVKTVYKGSPLKFYITAVAAVIYALSGPMYTVPNYIVFALVMVLVFLLSGKLFKGKKELVPIEPPKPKEKPEPKEEKKTSRTGDPEVDKIIDEGNEYLKKLRAANNAIPEETLSEDIDRMEKASADIFRYIEDHPEKAPQIRKFMNYYLPTTLKLLNSYQRLASQSVKGENITSTMFNIAGMMHTVATAFEKQLDSLFTDEAMDISADISVFETLLRQEGFAGEEEQKKSGF